MTIEVCAEMRESEVIEVRSCPQPNAEGILCAYTGCIQQLRLSHLHKVENANEERVSCFLFRRRE